MRRYLIFASTLGEGLKGWQAFRCALSDEACARYWLNDYKRRGCSWGQVVDTESMNVIASFGC